MSDFTQRMQRLRSQYEHQELHDLSNEKVMHMYYGVLLWVYAMAAIAGSYE